MRKFVRQKSNRQAPNVELDFGAAATKVARRITRDTLTPLSAAEQRTVIRLLRKLT